MRAPLRMTVPALALLLLAPAPPSGPAPPRAEFVPAPPRAEFVPAPRAEFGWPLSPRPPLGRAFAAPDNPYGPGHRGVDLLGAAGQPVLAAADGVIVYAGPVAGRGVVSIDHPGGLRTTYEPLTVSARAGDVVRRGERIGLLVGGHRGCPGPACLHWGLRRGREYLDPLLLVQRVPVRLLPWVDGL